MRSLIDLFQARLSCSGCVLEHPEGRLDFAELLERSRRQAGTLAARGWAGRPLVLVADNSLELVSALLACWWAGCLPACLAPPGRMQTGNYAESLHKAIVQTGAVVGFSDSRHLERLRGSVALGEDWQPLALPEAEPYTASVTPDQLAYLQFSSGTTLQPKPVRLSHANLLSNLEAIASQLPDNRTGHSCTSWLPLYHDMGLIGGLLAALYAPGSLTLLTPQQFALRPGSWLDAVSRSRSSISVAPNFALEQLLLRDEEQRDLSCLQRLWLGAETVQPDSLRRFYEHYRDQGLRWEALCPVYGLAEATLAVSFSQGPRIAGFHIPTEPGRAVAPGPRELVSLGRPLPGVELTLRDEEGEEVSPGCPGQIHIGGSGLAQGLEAPYPTGDVGFLWEGELYFVTRLKDILIHNGRNHDPEVVEQLLFPLVSAAVCVEEREVVCLVELPRRAQISPRELEESARAQLRAAPLPVRPVAVGPGWLPRTSSGKISRHQARRKYSHGI